jgi:hypothetical protein
LTVSTTVISILHYAKVPHHTKHFLGAQRSHTTGLYKAPPSMFYTSTKISSLTGSIFQIHYKSPLLCHTNRLIVKQNLGETNYFARSSPPIPHCCAIKQCYMLQEPVLRIQAGTSTNPSTIHHLKQIPRPNHPSCWTPNHQVAKNITVSCCIDH